MNENELEVRSEVGATYTRLVLEPAGDFHFHRGGAYAEAVLGYDGEDLRTLPAYVVERFAGVGNPLAAGPIHAGETALDLGSGAGTDLLLAARRTGVSGRVIGVDMTDAMIEIARRGAAEAGLAVELREGLLEELPVEDASVDVVLSNGVINLVLDKARVFREIRRVLKPGGRVQLADVIVARPFSAATRSDPDLWAACVAGAMSEDELRGYAAAAGFGEVVRVATHESFRGTAAERHVKAEMDVRGATFRIRG